MCTEGITKEGVRVWQVFRDKGFIISKLHAEELLRHHNGLSNSIPVGEMSDRSIYATFLRYVK